MLQFFKKLGRSKPSTFKPVILVTGCSSGLGLALATLLYRQRNYRVVVTARTPSLPFLKRRFKEDDRFWIHSLDVTVEKERRTLIKNIEEKWGGVNILVNNAGISYRAVLEHMTEGDEYLQLATNYLGPVGLMRLVLPYMRSQGRGKIINVSSVSGMLAMPTMASYSASKHALEGASEALWYEAKPFGINVSLLQPGFIRSKSFERVYYTALAKLTSDEGGAYADYYGNMRPFIARLMNRSLATPESVALRVLKVIRTENPPLWIPATLDAIVFYHIRRLLPRRLLQPLLFSALPNASRWGLGETRCRRRRTHPTQAATNQKILAFQRTRLASSSVGMSDDGKNDSSGANTFKTERVRSSGT